VSPFRRAARRVERAFLGMAMTAIAFVIERRVLKAIRAKGEKAEPATEAEEPQTSDLLQDRIQIR
jgi:hypothetical protein